MPSLDACSSCGKPVSRGPNSRPEIVCRACRRERSRLPRPPCAECGNPTKYLRNRYCSVRCANVALGRARRIELDGTKLLRVQRDKRARGLTAHQRRLLLVRWRSRGAGCFYCGGPAETVDHVIPLGRGGDNCEGNLVPACRRCNSAKCDLLLVEWRMRRDRGRTVQPEWRVFAPTPPPRERRRVWTGEQLSLGTCLICGALFAGAGSVTCGDAHCLREHVGRQTRDRYRAAHGLPVDPSQPTRYWLLLQGVPWIRKSPRTRPGVGQMALVG